MVDKLRYSRFGFNMPEKAQSIMTSGLADTGAQQMVISSALALNLGVKEDKMIPTRVNIKQ